MRLSDRGFEAGDIVLGRNKEMGYWVVWLLAKTEYGDTTSVALAHNVKPYKSFIHPDDDAAEDGWEWTTLLDTRFIYDNLKEVLTD